MIGDELLKGHVQDTNSHYLCKELWELGVKVGRVVVVPDDLEAIATEVRILSPLYDYVLTSGGVGPTHDDITMEGTRLPYLNPSLHHRPPSGVRLLALAPLIAVGRAFSEDLAPHPDILRFLFPKDPNSPSHQSHPWWKMVMIPTSSKVHIPEHEEGAFSFLLMTVHNVHCYPGVPALLRDIFTKCKVSMLNWGGGKRGKGRG